MTTTTAKEYILHWRDADERLIDNDDWTGGTEWTYECELVHMNSDGEEECIDSGSFIAGVDNDPETPGPYTALEDLLLARHGISRDAVTVYQPW